MIKFSQEKVLLLHQLIAQETGGDAGVRDYGLLESALESAYQTFGGEDLFPSKEEKAAKICFSLVSNHAFVDGNKRIGVYLNPAKNTPTSASGRDEFAPDSLAVPKYKI